MKSVTSVKCVKPVKCASHDSTTDMLILNSVVNHLKQPSSDLKKFDGNPLDFRKFMRQFKSKVVNNTDDDCSGSS